MSSRTDRALSRDPIGGHRAVVIGAVMALLLVAIAVLAVRDLVVAQGWATGQPWVPQVVSDLDGLTPSPTVLAVATLVALVGLALVLAAVLPAPRRHVRAEGPDQLWTTPTAVATAAAASVDRTPGVLSARVASASRKRVVLEVVGRRDESGAEVRDLSRDAAVLVTGALGIRRADVRLAEED